MCHKFFKLTRILNIGGSNEPVKMSVVATTADCLETTGQVWHHKMFGDEEEEDEGILVALRAVDDVEKICLAQSTRPL